MEEKAKYFEEKYPEKLEEKQIEDHSYDFQRKKNELSSLISSQAILRNSLKQQIDTLTKELNNEKKMNTDFDEQILNVNKVNRKKIFIYKIIK